MHQPSKYQKAIYNTFRLTKKNISISAVAGSGKTTTLLELLKYIPSGSSSIFLAFNNSVVDELKKRNQCPEVSIMTIHSCGWRAIMTCYGRKVKMNPNKTLAKTELAIKKFNIPTRKRGFYFYNLPKMLDLLRCNLCSDSKDDIYKIIEHYDLGLVEEDLPIIQYAFKKLNEDKRQFDFMDMIYVPVVDNLVRMKVHKYDYVFCDESQDFSKAQQEFIKLCLNRTGRLVTVGDPHQAIYGFAGADADSYERLANLSGKAIKLPLSVSYRCAKSIVLEAQKIVPIIQYAENSEYGEVRQGSLSMLERGDWILCRNLRPLVQTYLWLLKNRVKSKIRGKDIGEGILALINKTGAGNLRELDYRLREEHDHLHSKLEKKGIRRPEAHPKMEVLEQKMDVISCLMEEVGGLEELKKVIEDIFTDEIEGIVLSTIHKSKGLENNRIFFLCPELIPSKYATQDWELEQERNLMYVGITRAKKQLIYVSSETFLQDISNKVNV